MSNNFSFIYVEISKGEISTHLILEDDHHHHHDSSQNKHLKFLIAKEDLDLIMEYF